jgi:hypothetical protein
MRLSVAVLALCACRAFDPIAEVPHSHREYASTADAIAKIVDENRGTTVFAIGEYHQHGATSTPLQHFNTEVLPVLAPRAKSLLVEAWDPLPVDVEEMMMRALELHVPALTLPMTPIEYDAVVDASGHLDFLLLLELVTGKLAERTTALLARGPVIVYGGALHNDLYPRWPLDALSYAKTLAKTTRVLEIDLVVPEVVAPMAMIRSEPWFPLLGRASPQRALVWKRGPASYVVILPAQSEEVSRVAKLSDSM